MPEQLVRNAEFIDSPDSLKVDGLPDSEANQLVRELEAASQWLTALFRDDVRPWNSRRLRLILATCSAGILSSAVALFALSPRNIARGKTVTSSSQAFGTSPLNAVDGRIHGQLGFHSDLEDSPWLAIDLGAIRPIKRVLAYGRADCCFDQSVPMVAEVADDGVNYRQVGERTEPFDQFDPWVISLPSLRARFVRLRTTRHSYLVLSEVEVYAGSGY